MEDNPRSVIGGNNPPSQEELLKEKYLDLVTGLANWQGRASLAPEKIESDEVLTGVGKIITNLFKIRTRAKLSHTVEKEPFLTGGKVVDSFFNANIIAVCEDLEKKLERRQSTYIVAKESAQREAARLLEESKREEAEALLRTAQYLEDKGDIESASDTLIEAAEIEAAADTAAQVQAAAPQELTKVVSSGVTTKGKAIWSFEIEDFFNIDLNQLRNSLARTEIEKAIRAQVKNGIRSIPGVDPQKPAIRIFEDRKVTNKG